MWSFPSGKPPAVSGVCPGQRVPWWSRSLSRPVGRWGPGVLPARCPRPGPAGHPLPPGVTPVPAAVLRGRGSPGQLSQWRGVSGQLIRWLANHVLRTSTIWHGFGAWHVVSLRSLQPFPPPCWGPNIHFAEQSQTSHTFPPQLCFVKKTEYLLLVYSFSKQCRGLVTQLCLQPLSSVGSFPKGLVAALRQETTED